MTTIYSTSIPFKGYLAMCIYPFIFVRKELKDRYTPIVDNHENIHARQQKELFLIIFFLWYIVEYIVRIFQYKFNRKKAYRNICFEREAYEHERDFEYTRSRKHYAFLKYVILKKSYNSP